MAFRWWLLTLVAFCGAFDAVFPLRPDALGPFLYVGTHADARNAETLRLLRIKYILLLGKREVALRVLDVNRDEVTYHNVEMDGRLKVPEYREAISFLMDSMDKAELAPSAGTNLRPAHVMVASSGCQAASAVAIAFMVRRLKKSVKEVSKHVAKKRSCFTATPALLEMISSVDEVKKIPTTADEIADDLLKDVGRKVSVRALTAEGDYTLKGCAPVHDMVWYYGDIPNPEGADWFTANSTTSCCALCNAHPQCVYWSYGLADVHKERCFLKDGVGSYTEVRAHFVSGQRGTRPLQISKTAEL